MAAAKMRQIRSYTATYSITEVGSSTPALTGAVAWQNRPAVLADEKASSNGALALPGGVETIIDKNVVYLKISVLSRIFGKPWIKIDAASLSSTAAAMAPIVQSLQPSLMAEAQLLAASTKAHKVRTQVINGVLATEYAGTSTIGAGLRHLSPSLRQLLGAGLSSMPAPTHFTVWIDGQHIVRKEVATQRVPRGTAMVTFVVTSINQPVTVHVPPASQVARIPGL
jgi:hypothetical protein